MTTNFTELEKYQLIVAAITESPDDFMREGLVAIDDYDELFEKYSEGLFGISWDNLKKAWEELWKKVSPELWKVFCDPENDLHAQLADLIKKGSKNVDEAIAAVIVTVIFDLGIVKSILVGAVALFLAKIILREFFEAAYATGCDAWEKYNEKIIAGDQ